MNRHEFIEEINSWEDLIQFCNSYNDCYICDDVYDYDEKDDYIDNNFYELCREECWTTVRDYLNEIPTGSDYYKNNGSYLDWIELDSDDFEAYKQDALNWGDDNDIWDEEEADDDIDEEELDPVPEENISTSELFSICNERFQKFKGEATKLRNKENEQFNMLIKETVGKVIV